MNTLGNCIRAFLILYNIIIMLAGVGALATIIWLIISRYFVGKLIGLHMYVGILYMLLTASCLVVLISLIGYLGAANKIKWMLYLYGVILSKVFLILFIACMLGLLLKDRTVKMIKNILSQTINLYSKNSSIRQAWDEIQPYFKCCGVKTYEDWKENIPQSCCRVIKFSMDPQCNVTSMPPIAIYEGGCYTLVSDFVSSHLIYICMFGLTSGLLEVLGAAFSYALANMILQDELMGERDDFRDNWSNKRKRAIVDSE